MPAKKARTKSIKSNELLVEGQNQISRWKDVWIHLLGVIFSMLGAAASTLQVIGVSEGGPRFYITLAAIILTLVVFTLIALRIQRGPSAVGQIKFRLQSAYFDALDESY